jgi:cellulose synthase/poly-beta-1,6-N-acetylglucosamine synthase-like glycosyltransferase
MVLAASGIGLMIYYFAVIVFLRRGLGAIGAAGPAQQLDFSVIIAARNEASNIAACLESVLNQDIGPQRFEVILVDDRSTDQTRAIAQSYAGRIANLQVLAVEATPAGLSPKKHALSQGITRAKGTVLVFTDADCRVPPGWLGTIDRFMAPEVGLVQGITTYASLPGLHPLFFGLQAVDFLSHGIVSAAAIGAGLPINSNANNFAIRRQAFDELGGFAGVSGVISGDDDLLLQKVWRSGRWKLRYMADAAGAVKTMPTPTVAGVLEQRKRWGSKTVHYNPGQVMLLAGIFLFYLAIPAALIAGLWRPSLLLVCAGMVAAKFLGELVLMIPGTRLFDCRELRPFLLPASLLQLPMVLYAVLSGVFGRFEWKGQRHRRTAAR